MRRRKPNPQPETEDAPEPEVVAEPTEAKQNAYGNTHPAHVTEVCRAPRES